MAISTKKRLVHAGAIVLAMSPVTAVTQSAPVMDSVPVSYTGLALDWFADSIRIVQPDGTLAEYRGPLPPLSLRAGDTVNFTYNVRQPRGLAFDSSRYTGQIAADGRYKIGVNQMIESSGSPWLVIGGGRLNGRPFIEDDEDDPLSASYQVGYDANTGKTTIEAGTMPPPADLDEQPIEAGFAAEEPEPEPPVTELVETEAPAEEQGLTTVELEMANSDEPKEESLPPVSDAKTGESENWDTEMPPQTGGPGPVPVPAPGGLLILLGALALFPLRKRLARS